MKVITLLLIGIILCVSTPAALARSSAVYKTEMLVTKGDKTKEIKSKINFDKEEMTISPNVVGETAKTFKYADIKSADYSFSKKPMWKQGVIAAVFVGVLALPLFFMKSKSHWLTVRTENDFAVLKLEKSNYRQIKAELETHGVTVNEVADEEKSEKKKTK